MRDHKLRNKARPKTLGSRRCLGCNEQDGRCVNSCRSAFCKRPSCIRVWYGLPSNVARQILKISRGPCPDKQWEVLADLVWGHRTSKDKLDVQNALQTVHQLMKADLAAAQPKTEPAQAAAPAHADADDSDEDADLSDQMAGGLALDAEDME